MLDGSQEQQVAADVARAAEKADATSRAVDQAAAVMKRGAPASDVEQAVHVAQAQAKEAEKAVRHAADALGAPSTGSAADAEGEDAASQIARLTALVKPVTRSGEITDETQPATVRSLARAIFSELPRQRSRHE